MPFYRQQIVATTNAGTLITVETLAVLPERVVRITHCGLLNASGETVTAQLGVQDGESFLPIQPKQTVANNDATAIVDEFLIYEGQRLAAQVTGTADHGPVTLYASGMEFDFDPPPEPVAVAVIPQQKKPVTNY